MQHQKHQEQHHHETSSSPYSSAPSPSSLSLRQTKPVLYAFKYLNSPATQTQYPKRFKVFLDHLRLPGATIEEQAQVFIRKAREDPYWAQENIILFLDFHKQRVQRREISAGTLKNYYSPIKAFFDAHEDNLPSIKWKRIARALPKSKTYSSNDRAPTIGEIRKLVEYPDRRIKPLVYAMASGGFRVGAWQHLRWKHVIPKIDEKTGEIVAAKMIIYDEDGEEYYTFITPEAYNSLKDWMDFRASYGEKITGESWLMRNVWRTADIKRGGSGAGGGDGGAEGASSMVGGRYGLATHPKKMSVDAIKKMLGRALYQQGLRESLQNGSRRHAFKMSHSYRKFFKTRAEQVMNRTNVEYIIGHNLGVSQSYYKPLERDVLADYLKAVDLLTIDNDRLTLQKQVAKLTERNEEEIYIIKGKLTEKENEIEYMKRQFEELKSNQDKMMKTAANMQRVEDFINQYSDKNLPQNIESMIWEFLDPEEGLSIQERTKRNRKFPELLKAARRLQKLRLDNNKKRRRK